MELEQTVRAAFELREPAPDFEDVVMARLSAGAWRASQAAPRRRRHIVLIGTLLVVTAAAAMLVLRLMNAQPEAAVQGSNLEAAVQPGAAATAKPGPRTAEQELVSDESPARPVTVALLLDQVTGDAIGRDYGLRVYERAREELRATPGMVLVDAGTAGTAPPAYRITYINLAVSSGSSVQVEMVFQVEALQPGADGSGSAYKPVFRSSPPPPGVVDMPPSIRQLTGIPSFEQEPWLLASSARVSIRPGASPSVPADCIERREGRCHYTPADIAAFTILSWRLQTTPPDPLLAGRLHAMLRDPSSPPGLWMMALVNLHEYGKLHLDMPELLAAAERIGDADPALQAALVREAIKVGGRAGLMRQVRDLLRSSASRVALVNLLATEFRNEPDAREILESVAATDPTFEIRATAKRALGLEPEAKPQPLPTPSFMGPIDEQ